MKFAIEKRDLFTVPKDYYLCHCVSGDLALGAGIAKKFAELGVKDALKKDHLMGYTRNGELIYYSPCVGDCLCTCATEWQGEFNLVTKERYFQKPTERTLRQALTQMRRYCRKGDKIAMPKIGCGLDKLKWNDVEQIIKDVFENTDVEILVCDWK